ncbi:MAG: hypothetical protein EVJ46_09945 [Candidatus Acididesulfobacter guangdongensis]|uniref:Uncharacterized protein n=1 Tax=Acididesulfobacter guangdongensis TaxID=2597225 RepID=A0A519BE77_ACIG2|nr:MAG: hypothetical protein EVJ46_09945 [Candidatus Acididesulfobacter guangdongensis]
MKNIQTNKVKVFENWRISVINNYGEFIWPQINYNLKAEPISIVFEIKNNINNPQSILFNQICQLISSIPINCIKISFQKNSPYKIDNTKISSMLNLTLSKNISNNDLINSYWQYRLETRPLNCLTCDIDSLELSNNKKLISIEATYLFDTVNIQSAIENIFKTFKFRCNKVNPKQYLVQQNFISKLNGKAYILFHQISNNTTLDTKNQCLLLENNELFYPMLTSIKDKNIDIQSFLKKYGLYLSDNLKAFSNIYYAYNYIQAI